MIIITFLVLLVVIAPLLAKYRGVPEALVAELQKMNEERSQAPQLDMKHSVWVNERSGLYYCRASRFYGRMSPGRYMRQESALLKGFRPAGGDACP